ncbi:hypothetical protein BU24DRAFT_420244 [Aaosphaeria arxii CBS 175.79]|uniref:Chitin biosynthesis protein n=1 Tax=Aaosphaeria arxii CBS 175.79 TaxID=1450172 RepID=A0A6A5XWI5_9PLEO|nr:uncharacterized protein BU24DRAFT_420244 [Aaosphaeria arxii CBS 175.79]KAF2017207.1 hypothetical protein BU24DRAFT_420244 [Aaosphaeria arxii CBS 175.79]
MSTMLVSLTVGKVDAGVAVLLTEDKRLIEFPSILLPPDISSGSIVDITVARNLKSESDAAASFHSLQSTIFRTFGQRTPSPPVLRCRNATQTSVVLEWDPIDIATAELRGLTLYRNGSKAGTIPKPTELHSTKLSGLAVDTEYVFHLILRTSAGTYSSEKLRVQTHKMTDLSGITITPGHMPAALRESLQKTVERIGAKIVDTVRIDTTHFVCTEGRGPAWEKAVENNIPVVVPDWVKGCERDGRIVGVRGYYLNADPRLRHVGPPTGPTPQPQGTPQLQAEQARSPPLPSPRTEVTPPTPERPTRERGQEQESSAPPPPPPKDVESASRSPSLPSSPTPPEPKIQTEEQKVRTEDLKPSAEEDDDEAESEGEGASSRDAKAVEAGIPERPKSGGRVSDADEGEGDGDGSFQDVKL